MKRTPRCLIASVVVAVILSSCSGGSGDTAASTSSTAASNGRATTNSDTVDRKKAVQFAECMRTKGIPDFPDPDASGKFKSGIGDAAAWERAFNACKAFEPPGFFGDNSSPAEMARRLLFAECMRKEGIADFPDPIKDGPLLDTRRIPSMANKSVKSDKPFNDAAKVCLKVYESAGGGK